MPIFTPPPAPPAPVLPLAERKRRAAQAVRAMSRQGYLQLCQIQKQGIRAVFENPDTPAQDILDEIGTDAGKIFTAHAALTQMIASVAALDESAPDILLPPNELITNPDGTITIGEGPYVLP